MTKIVLIIQKSENSVTMEEMEKVLKLHLKRLVSLTA